MTHALMQSPLLAQCRGRVVEAGCEVMPAWANGAKLFVPFLPEQLAESDIDTEELNAHHILALHREAELVKEVLLGIHPKKAQPKL